jgi:hypothetical protein
MPITAAPNFVVGRAITKHRRHPMRRLVSIAVFLTIFAFVPLAAQDDGPNVVRVTYHKTLPGKAAAFNARTQEMVPLYEELIRRGKLVSTQRLIQQAGTGEFTHLNIREYANWDAVNDITSEDFDAACQTVFGMTMEERQAEMVQKYGELETLRTRIRREFYSSLKP